MLSFEVAFPPNAGAIKPKTDGSCRLWLDAYLDAPTLAKLIVASQADNTYTITLTPVEQSYATTEFNPETGEVYESGLDGLALAQ